MRACQPPKSLLKWLPRPRLCCGYAPDRSSLECRSVDPAFVDRCFRHASLSPGDLTGEKVSSARKQYRLNPFYRVILSSITSVPDRCDYSDRDKASQWRIRVRRLLQHY